jgi:hypothetical protein
MVVVRDLEQATRSRKCTGFAAWVTLRLWTPICRSTSTRSPCGVAALCGAPRRRREVLRLIKLWLKTPIEERDADGKRRLTGGKRADAARHKAASVLCWPTFT